MSKSYVKQMKEFLDESHGYTWDEEQGKYVRIDDSSETDESTINVDEMAYTWDEDKGEYIRIDDAPAGLTKESVELDEKVDLKGLSNDAKGLLASAINFAATDGGPYAEISNLDYFTPEAIADAMKFINTNKSRMSKSAMKPYKELQKFFKESVELDELKRDEPEVVFDFKSERDAKQFAKDVENSSVGLANKGVERYKGKYRVVITGMTKDMHKKAIGKYAHKNKGEFSHSSSEVTPKGYGPYDEEA